MDRHHGAGKAAVEIWLTSTPLDSGLAEDHCGCSKGTVEGFRVSQNQAEGCDAALEGDESLVPAAGDVSARRAGGEIFDPQEAHRFGSDEGICRGSNSLERMEAVPFAGARNRGFTTGPNVDDGCT